MILSSYSVVGLSSRLSLVMSLNYLPISKFVFGLICYDRVVIPCMKFRVLVTKRTGSFGLHSHEWL